MNKDNVYNDEQIFKEYLKYRNDEDSPHSIEVKPIIVDLVGNVKGKKVLDIGCGAGDLALCLSQKEAKNVVGIDISDRSITYANLNNKRDNIEYRVMNICDLDKLESKYDIVISDMVFNYISDFKVVMKNINNLLEDNGTVVFSQIHPFSTAPLNGRVWSKDEEGNDFFHLSDYGKIGARETSYFGGKLEIFHRTFADVINAIIEAGFEIVKFIEPTPSKEIIGKLPDRIKEIHKPSFLIVKLIKRK